MSLSTPLSLLLSSPLCFLNTLLFYRLSFLPPSSLACLQGTLRTSPEERVDHIRASLLWTQLALSAVSSFWLSFAGLATNGNWSRHLLSCSVVYGTTGSNIFFAFLLPVLLSLSFSLSMCHWKNISTAGLNFLPSEMSQGQSWRWMGHLFVYFCMCVLNTFTNSGVQVEGKASWTFTVETTKRVDAPSSLAQAGQFLTLIDVCGREKGKTQHHCGLVFL